MNYQSQDKYSNKKPNSIIKTNYYSLDNPELKMVETIKQREFAKISHELALEKLNADREA
jgi:hypothetical protein